MSYHGDGERRDRERQLREALERAQGDYLSASRENQAIARERYLQAVYAYAEHILQDPVEAKLAVSLVSDRVHNLPRPAAPPGRKESE
jgi:hypothetical protein